MAVVFDYSAYLQNSRQLVLGSYPSDSSETAVTPNAYVFFWSLFNPGHAGTASVIEFNFTFLFTLSTAVTPSLLYVWQIKPSGGAWATIGDAGQEATATITATGAHTQKGVYTTAVLMPCEIQCIGTDNSDNWLLTTGTSSYICAMRAYGAV